MWVQSLLEISINLFDTKDESSRANRCGIMKFVIIVGRSNGSHHPRHRRDELYHTYIVANEDRDERIIMNRV